MKAQDVMSLIKEKSVKAVDLRFVDLPGLWQHFTVSTKEFAADVFEEGIGFDGSSIRGFQAINESDMSLFPDPTTAYLDPFRKAKTLWSKDDTGTVKCCMMPGRSQKRTSIISTPSSLMNLSSSSELLNIRFLLDGDQRASKLQRHGTGPRCTVVVTLGGSSF